MEQLLTPEQEQKLNKIKNYKGNVIARWKWEIPSNEKEALVMLRKALRLFYRAIESNFLITDLYRSLKDYVVFVAKRTSVLLLAHPEIIAGINEVKHYHHDDAEYEIYQEKIRKKKLEKCSLCNTVLKWPAYVIKRKDKQILSVSKPIGIKCLNGFVGKLKDLVSTFEVEQFVEKKKVKTPPPHHRPIREEKQLSLF